jgi:putative transposase
MPLRETPLVSNEFYHVFNRGVARQPTFKVKKDYERFMLCMTYYSYESVPIKLSRLLTMHDEDRVRILSELSSQNSKKVDIISYVLMPNHFHMLLRQVVDNGISKYMKQAINSYSKYFNTRHERVGPMFQGVFKAVRIETDEQLIHLSRYIHLNPFVSSIVKEKDLVSYPWSSLPVFLGVKNDSLISTEPVTQYFSDMEKYKRFVFDHMNYARKLEVIKHILHE